ncbi:MAG TPA: hypothetical protein VK602_16185 [Phyllobacterium sp.]|nr:hypothetical protein [Phyllobacterium sp.]
MTTNAGQSDRWPGFGARSVLGPVAVTTTYTGIRHLRGPLGFGGSVLTGRLNE